jgi:hypothetical protein
MVRMLQANHIEVIISGDFNMAGTPEGVFKALQIQCHLEFISNPQNVDTSIKNGKKWYKSCNGK